MTASAFTLLLVTIAVSISAKGGFSDDFKMPTQTEAPVLGILVEPPAWNTCVTLGSDDGHQTTNVPEPTLPPNGTFTGCIWSLYVKWAQSAGIRVVPVPYKTDTPEEVALLRWYLDRVNGILLPGGQLGMGTTTFDRYFNTVRYIFNYTLERNTQHRDPFVFWGTCQGFEMINAAAAGTTDILHEGFTGMSPLMMAVNFTDFGKRGSMMFGTENGTGDAPWGTPRRVVDYMENYPTTANWHQRGIHPCEYATSSSPACANSSWVTPGSTLGRFMTPIATSTDTSGNEFVAAAEAVDGIKIFTIQFHPEKPMCDFRRDAITHDHRSLCVSQYLALFLRDQLTQNSHAFDTPEQANSLTIENHKYAQIGWGVQIYFI